MNANAVSEDDCRGRRHSATERYDPQSCDGPVFVHAIAADEVMERLGAHSALNTSRVFLRHLRDAGRRHAGEWLERCHADLGVRSTIDLSAEHL